MNDKNTWQVKSFRVGLIIGIVIDIILLIQDWLFSNSKECGFWDKIYCTWSQYLVQMWFVYLIIGFLVIFASIIIVTIAYWIRSLFHSKNDQK